VSQVLLLATQDVDVSNMFGDVDSHSNPRLLPFFPRLSLHHNAHVFTTLQRVFKLMIRYQGVLQYSKSTSFINREYIKGL
jgi:hypothetical protein